MEEILAHADGFRGLPPDGLRQLTQMGRLRTFPKGCELMHQGDVGEVLHVIVRGRAKVQRTHPDLLEPLELAELQVGEMVGEMGLLDGSPRSATVVAAEETDTFELSATELSEILVQYPAVSGELLRLLSRRIRSTDDLAVEIRRRNAAEMTQQESRNGRAEVATR